MIALCSWNILIYIRPQTLLLNGIVWFFTYEFSLNNQEIYEFNSATYCNYLKKDKTINLNRLPLPKLLKRLVSMKLYLIVDL